MIHSTSMGDQLDAESRLQDPFRPIHAFQNSKIVIPSTVHYDLVRISDIVRCEGWQKYTRIYLKNGKCLVSSYHLGIYKKGLSSRYFYSPHKSHLINIGQIARYRKEGVIVMEDGAEVPVARRRKEAFLADILSRFLLQN